MAAPAVYRGSFGRAQAERLLWRAGFGPRPGEADRLARKGLDAAVESLINPGREQLAGKAPRVHGKRLAPLDAWGHDHLWWLDRMVRTSRPLVERMTLIWHDWFATSNDGVDSQRLMLQQNGLFRRNSLGSFRELLLEVTHDPAMLLWLNGVDNEKEAPNENYAREMMELFTLGADRGAYTERDVREQARALTGWARDWKYGRPYFHYDRKRHDTGTKRVFGKTGNYDWRDACLLAPQQPGPRRRTSSTKLWSYFIPTKPNAATQRALRADLHRRAPDQAGASRRSSSTPTSTRGPRMVKPPVVHTAGLLRALGRGDRQRLAGSGSRRSPGSGSSTRRTWPAGTRRAGSTRRPTAGAGTRRPTPASRSAIEPSRKSTRPTDPDEACSTARTRSGASPASTPTTRGILRSLRARAPITGSKDQRAANAVLAENALRQLIAVSPDLQTC